MGLRQADMNIKLDL